jgi:hypothetical protein
MAHFISAHTFEFAIGGLLTGIAAAILWAWTASVRVSPGWSNLPLGDFPSDPEVQYGWLNDIYVRFVTLEDGLKRSAQLNKWAAIMTAVSVLLNALATLGPITT